MSKDTEIISGDKVFITDGKYAGKAGWVEQISGSVRGRMATVLLVHPTIKGKDRIREPLDYMIFLSRKPDA
jgi:ribosomal protein L24